MNLLLVVEDGRTRRWMAHLAVRLATVGYQIRYSAVPARQPVEAGIELLIDLERMVMRRHRADGGDRVAAEAIAPRLCPEFRADVVVDLTSEPQARPGIPVFAVCYDGVAGEGELIASLMSHATPIAEVVDMGSGAVVERSLASLESAIGLGGAIDAVCARVITVLEARLRAVFAGRERALPPALETVPRTRRQSVPNRIAHSAGHLVARALYRLCCHAPHWRIGWRLHDGPGIAETGDFSGAPFRILPDPGHRFYADPFPVTWEGRSFVFVEDLDHRCGKGVVSAVPFDESGPSGPAVVVLEEPWHLSYPFCFEHDGHLWMIPESTGAGVVALYRCTRFPDRWERVATLLGDLALSDATVFRHAGEWWMLGTLHDGEGGWSDTLVVHRAPDLFGPWQPLEANPVLVDRSAARPAGAVFRRGERLFRPVQDCADGYGGAMALVEITRLDDAGYAQTVRHRLRPGPHWPGRRLHTLNRCGRLEVVDGSVPRPKSPLLARFVEAATVPAGGRP